MREEPVDENPENNSSGELQVGQPAEVAKVQEPQTHTLHAMRRNSSWGYLEMKPKIHTIQLAKSTSS